MRPDKRIRIGLQMSIMVLCLFSRIESINAAGAIRTLGYKISAEMWYPPQNSFIKTPAAVLSKIRKAFEVYETVDQAHLKFEDRGLDEMHFRNRADIPKDGLIHIVLHESEDELDAISGDIAFGGYDGSIPQNYENGFVFVGIEKGLFVLSMKTLIHEIGHALGLEHAPSLSQFMNCGTSAWGDRDYYGLSQGDALQLIDRWNPASLIYALSGTVRQTSFSDGFAMAVAVDEEMGRYYADLTDKDGKFRILISERGQYHLIAMPLPARSFDPYFPQRTSWYVKDDVSSVVPDTAKIFRLGDQKKYENLSLVLQNESAGLALQWGGSLYGPENEIPAFLKPGHVGYDSMEWITNDDEIQSAAVYGKNPDVQIEEATLHGNQKAYSRIRVKAAEHALPGDRLVLVKSKKGIYQTVLMGIQVTDMNFAEVSEFNADENKMIQDQIDKGLDLSKLDLKKSGKAEAA